MCSQRLASQSFHPNGDASQWGCVHNVQRLMKPNCSCDRATALCTPNLKNLDHRCCVAQQEWASPHTWFLRFDCLLMETSNAKVHHCGSLIFILSINLIVAVPVHLKTSKTAHMWITPSQSHSSISVKGPHLPTGCQSLCKSVHFN